MANITVACLIYRSTKWLDFVLEGLQAHNETKFETLVVANDPFPAIRKDPRVNHIHENEDPREYYLSRVYRAWNKVVEIAETEFVVLVNSDMYFSEGWLDALVAAYSDTTLPTSLLVESGWIPSAFPEYVRDFGRTPDSFDRQRFLDYANMIRQSGVTRPGRLFMPVLFKRKDFMDIGGYPIQRRGEMSGDKILFNRFKDAGFNWVTCYDSVCWHAVEGELRDGT